jgi:hypothetical protein
MSQLVKTLKEQNLIPANIVTVAPRQDFSFLQNNIIQLSGNQRQLAKRIKPKGSFVGGASRMYERIANKFGRHLPTVEELLEKQIESVVAINVCAMQIRDRAVVEVDSIRTYLDSLVIEEKSAKGTQDKNGRELKHACVSYSDFKQKNTSDKGGMIQARRNMRQSMYAYGLVVNNVAYYHNEIGYIAGVEQILEESVYVLSKVAQRSRLLCRTFTRVNQAYSGAKNAMQAALVLQQGIDGLSNQVNGIYMAFYQGMGKMKTLHADTQGAPRLLSDPQLPGLVDDIAATRLLGCEFDEALVAD